MRRRVSRNTKGVPGDWAVWFANGTTDSSGSVRFDIGADFFVDTPVCSATVVRNTTTPANFAFAFVRTASPTEVVVQVAESRTATSGQDRGQEALEKSGAGLTVSFIAFGHSGPRGVTSA